MGTTIGNIRWAIYNQNWRHEGKRWQYLYREADKMHKEGKESDEIIRRCIVELPTRLIDGFNVLLVGAVREGLEIDEKGREE